MTETRFSRLAFKHKIARDSGAGFNLPEEEFETVIEALEIADRVQKKSAIRSALAEWPHSKYDGRRLSHFISRRLLWGHPQTNHRRD